MLSYAQSNVFNPDMTASWIKYAVPTFMTSSVLHMYFISILLTFRVYMSHNLFKKLNS